ncbi:hypothetical protein DFR75_101357 [Nocardia ignorata]|uniref:Uncharacterized protein n=1 Tax=Nocardia ignorata TaxID=145285 RepID=A0A4R6PRG6_NOCIG|nr:hypothetical protein DFR75_101357 [Nocardia ignorata]
MRPTNSSGSGTRALRSVRFQPATFTGYSTLPAAVRDRKRLNCWNTMPISRRGVRTADSGTSVIGMPEIVTVPDVGFSTTVRIASSQSLTNS